MVLDCGLVENIIGEKTVLPADNAGSIVLDADADSAVAKYETVDARPVVPNANAEFDVLFIVSPNGHEIELTQELQEVSQKYVGVSSPISIGADDMLVVMPLKSVGRVQSIVEPNVVVNEIKNAIIDGKNSYDGLMTGASLGDPFTVYYGDVSGTVHIGADVKSLGRLVHLRLIQSAANIGADLVDFDYYRSLGKFPARIAVGTDVSFNTEYFIGGENLLVFTAETELFSCKLIVPHSGMELTCTGAAVLRRMRLLNEADALGTLADIDDMTLENMYYVDI